jgi:hypothetical protein
LDYAGVRARADKVTTQLASSIYTVVSAPLVQRPKLHNRCLALEGS